jgi:hypothetical protein
MEYHLDLNNTSGMQVLEFFAYDTFQDFVSLALSYTPATARSDAIEAPSRSFLASSYSAEL